MDFGTFITYAQLPMILLALAITWKYESSRYFLILLLLVEVVDEALYKTSLTWTTHHYLYCMIMDVFFVMPIVYRKQLASWMYNKTNIPFFRRVSDTHHFALQEIGLLFIFAVNFAINFVVYIEVWIYKWQLIEALPIKNTIRIPVQVTLHVLSILTLITYMVKTPARERFYHG